MGLHCLYVGMGGNIQILLNDTPFMVTRIVTEDITVDATLGLDLLEANNCVIDCGLRLLTFLSQSFRFHFSANLYH